MLNLRIVSLVLALCVSRAAMADTILLKDRASITGKVIEQKSDAVAVDVGYTVLLVPRSSIDKISSGDEDAAAAKKASAQKGTPVKSSIETKGDFYQVALQPGPEQSVLDLVNHLGEAVVQVRNPSGLGSGFIINEDGYLITNFHVIEGETEIAVEVYHQTDGQFEPRTYKNVRIVAINKFADLALLKIDDKDAPKFKHIVIGSADATAVGEHVFAIGSPMGLERTVTEGILSTKTRQMQGDLYLQTTAQINPGNSGGPLFNLSGEVIGVTNMKIMFGEGLGFAIPAEVVRYFLDHRDAYSYSNDNPGTAYHYLEPPSRTRHLAEDGTAQ